MYSKEKVQSLIAYISNLDGITDKIKLASSIQKAFSLTRDLTLANTTFLHKISHSSQDLRVDNIKGSFNGHDIMREFEGVCNGAPVTAVLT